MARKNPATYNFSKLEFELMLLTKHYTKLASRSIRGFVVHHMTIVGKGDGGACVACYNTWQKREASAHYSVDGKYVAQHVYDKDYAWATGSNIGNLYYISVEHANKTAGPQWLVDEETFRTGAKLIANGHVLYKLGRPVDGKTLMQHDQFTSTACPGPFLGGTDWKRYVALVQMYYDEITKTKPPVTVPPATKPTQHTVKAGDTLWALSDKYDVTVAQLAEWNKLEKPYIIDIGQVLRLTAPKPPTTSAPKPVVTAPKAVTVDIVGWNVAGSDDTNGYGAQNATRGDDVGRYASKIGFDVFLACEAGQDNLRVGISKGLNIQSWSEHAKAIWYREGRVNLLASRESFRDDSFVYLKTYKWGAALFGSKYGKKFSVLMVHTDYRKPAKQAKQLQSIFKKFRKRSDALGIKHTNQYVVGDFNWDGTKGDNPFKALEDWNFEEKGNTTKYTFMERKHLDGVLAHEGVEVEVWVMSRSDGTRKLSDHNPIKFRVTLT